MDLQEIDKVLLQAVERKNKRRSGFDDEVIPPPTPINNNSEQDYKKSLEKEIKEWVKVLQKKYIHTKISQPPQFRSDDETNLKLTDAQEAYLLQAPDFHKMIADRKEFVKYVEYYLNLRSSFVENVEYRHNLLHSIANKTVRDIIGNAIYE